MQIQINPRQIKITDAIQAYIEQKIGHLEHYDEEIRTAHVTVDHDETRTAKHAFVVKVQLAIAHADLRAEDHGHDLYQAVDLVMDRLIEQLRHRKSKLIKGSREAARKAKTKRQIAVT